MILLLLVTVFLGVFSEPYSSKASTHYLAAVVEYSPETSYDLSGLQLVMKNVAHYEKLIATASSQSVDIIVFPEDGLTGIGPHKSAHIYSEVPHPDEFACPCKDPSKWSEPLRRLSCAARENRIYVSVNLFEQCGQKRHNTNVVFNREGVVVSRYRKLHLFNELNVQVPDENDFRVFHTDFGVIFGVTICFDLMFGEPAHYLNHNRKIQHFIYPTAWFSEVPFLTAVQTQASWAWSHNAVLLASGLNGPKLGNGGSGIFVGRKGPIKTIFTDQDTTKLLIARVPKDLNIDDDSCTDQTDKHYERISGPQDDNVKDDFCTETDKKHFGSSSSGKLRLLKDWLQSFATQLLPLEGIAEDNIKLCHEEFCCFFDIESKHPTGTDEAISFEHDLQQYRLFVWNGVRDFGGAATGGVQVCGVVACANSTDVMTCGLPVSTYTRKVIFSKLQISGAFESKSTMIMANTMNRSMVPLPAHSFNLTESEDACDTTATSKEVKCMRMTLLKEQEEVQTFAIYSRVFERDGSKYTHTKP